MNKAGRLLVEKFEIYEQSEKAVSAATVKALVRDGLLVAVLEECGPADPELYGRGCTSTHTAYVLPREAPKLARWFKERDAQKTA